LESQDSTFASNEAFSIDFMLSDLLFHRRADVTAKITAFLLL